MSFPGSVLLSAEQTRDQTSTQRFPLGTRGYTRDGRSFRYCKAGATAIKQGKLIQSEAGINGVYGKRFYFQSAYTSNSTKFGIKCTATHKLSTANYFAEGYLFISTGGTSQVGQYMQIASHLASTGSATIVYVDPVPGEHLINTVTTTTAIRLGIIANPYKKVILSAKNATPTAQMVGVTVAKVTANYYFWAQTWGPCVVKNDSGSAAWVAGQKLIWSATDTGALSGSEATASVVLLNPTLGHAMEVGADANHCMAMLTIAP